MAPRPGFKTRKPSALPEGAVVCFLSVVGGRGVLEKTARRTYRGRQSRYRVGCCRGRWCVYDDRRDRTSATVLRVYTSDLWTSPRLLPHAVRL